MADGSSADVGTKRAKRGKIDYWLFFIVCILLCVGLVMVLSASQYAATYEKGDSYYYLKRQLFNIAVGFVAMFFAVNIDYRNYKHLAWPIFGVGVVLMCICMFTSLGDSSGGSERWIKVGPIRFLPSDVMKLSMLVVIAAMMSKQKLAFRSMKFAQFMQEFTPYVLIGGVSCGLVAINDLGTGIVMAITLFLIFIVVGVRKRYLLAMIAAGIGVVALMILWKPYRMKRLTSFLDPWADYYGTGYQVVQSLLAIGSGGLMGVGLGNGGAKWFYLPERHTDFIYSIVVEEGGFIGGCALLLLFLAFTWRGMTIALKIEDTFGSLLATGLTLMISVQALVNMAIALGMMPVTGITLPFISYGGTSLVISLAAVGVLLNISRYAKMKK